MVPCIPAAGCPGGTGRAGALSPSGAGQGSDPWTPPWGPHVWGRLWHRGGPQLLGTGSERSPNAQALVLEVFPSEFPGGAGVQTLHMEVRAHM